MSDTPKPHISVVVMGPESVGKTDLVGRLLVECAPPGSKYALRGPATSPQHYQRIGRGSRDSSTGSTSRTNIHAFATSKHQVTLFDTPGRPKMFNKSTTCICQADIALLVFNYEEGVEPTRRLGPSTWTARCRLLAAYSMGIRQFIVAIGRKTRRSDLSESNFDEMKAAVIELFGTLGIEVGVTAKTLLSIVALPTLLDAPMGFDDSIAAWYTGDTVLQALESCRPPRRLTSRPFALAIRHVYPLMGGKIVAGRVLTGTESIPSTELRVSPAGAATKLESAEMHNKALLSVTAGECVGVKATAAWASPAGSVIHSQSLKVVATRKFKAKLLIVFGSWGSEPRSSEFLIHTNWVRGRISEFTNKVPGPTGSASDRYSLQDTVEATVTFSSSIAVTTYENCPALGRFCVFSGQRVTAIGTIIDTSA